jgi:2'-5' RNA ligase
MEQIRTFIAIGLDEQALAAVVAVQREFQKKVPPGVVRWVRPGGIHLTLQFLGNVLADRVPAIREGVSAACRGVPPFTILIRDVGCFPNLKRPRVVWVGVSESSGALNRLYRQVQDNMAALGFEPDKRPFNPHLTLGRVKKNTGAGEVRRLGEVMAAAELGTIDQMEVSSIHLIRSDLKPSGAVYTSLVEASLSADQ